jgi:hypothetical protein
VGACLTGGHDAAAIAFGHDQKVINAKPVFITGLPLFIERRPNKQPCPRIGGGCLRHGQPIAVVMPHADRIFRSGGVKLLKLIGNRIA